MTFPWLWSFFLNQIPWLCQAWKTKTIFHDFSRPTGTLYNTTLRNLQIRKDIPAHLNRHAYLAVTKKPSSWHQSRNMSNAYLQQIHSTLRRTCQNSTHNIQIMKGASFCSATIMLTWLWPANHLPDINPGLSHTLVKPFYISRTSWRAQAPPPPSCLPGCDKQTIFLTPIKEYVKCILIANPFYIKNLSVSTQDLQIIKGASFPSATIMLTWLWPANHLPDINPGTFHSHTPVEPSHVLSGSAKFC